MKGANIMVQEQEQEQEQPQPPVPGDDVSPPTPVDIDAIRQQVMEGNTDAALVTEDWKGHTNYRCALCVRDESSLDHARMRTHVQRAHGARPTPAVRVVAGLVDRSGDPILMPDVNGNPANPPPAPTDGIGAQ